MITSLLWASLLSITCPENVLDWAVSVMRGDLRVLSKGWAVANDGLSCFLSGILGVVGTMSSQKEGASGGSRSLWGRLFGGRGEAPAQPKDEAGKDGKPHATANTALPTAGVARVGVGVGLEFDGREMMPGPVRVALPASPSLPHDSRQEHGQASTHSRQETATQPSLDRGAVVREHGPAPSPSVESRPASSTPSALGASTPHAKATGLTAPLPPVALPPATAPSVSNAAPRLAPAPTRLGTGESTTGTEGGPPVTKDNTQQPTHLKTDTVAVKPMPTPPQPQPSVESQPTPPSEPPASAPPPDEQLQEAASDGSTAQEGESGAEREEGEGVSLALRLGEAIRRRLGGVMGLFSSSSSSSGSDDEDTHEDHTTTTTTKAEEGQGPEGAGSQPAGQQSKRRRPPKSQRTPLAERLQQATAPAQQPQAPPQPQPRHPAPSLRQPPQQQQASRQSLGARWQQSAPPQQSPQQALPPQQIAPPKRQPSRQQPLAERWQQAPSAPQPPQPQPRLPPPSQQQQPRPAVLGRGPINQPSAMPYPSLGPQPQGGVFMGQGRGGRPMLVLARPSLDAGPGRGTGIAMRPEWTGHDAAFPTGLPPGPPFMPPPRAHHSMAPRPIYQPPPMRAREGPGNGPEGGGAGRPAPPLPQLRPDAPGFPAPPSMRPQELSLSQLVLNLRTTLHEISVQRETHQRRVAQLTVLPRPYDPAWNWELEREVMGVRAMDDAYARCEARIRQLEPRPQLALSPTQQASAIAIVRQREDEWLETVERSMARRRDDAQHVEAQSTQQATGGDGSTGTAPPPSPASVPHASPRPGTLRPSAPAFAFTPRHEGGQPQPVPVAAETRTAGETKDAAQAPTPPPFTPQQPPVPPPSLRPSLAQQPPSSAPVLLEEGGGQGSSGGTPLSRLAPPSQEGVVASVEHDRQASLQEPGGDPSAMQWALPVAGARQREKEWLEAAEQSTPMQRQELEQIALESRNNQLSERLLERRASGQATGGPPMAVGDGSTVTAPLPSPASLPHVSLGPGVLRPIAPTFAFTPRHEGSAQPSPVADPKQAAETRTADEPKEATQDVQAPPPPSAMPQEPPAPPPSLGPSMSQQAPPSAPVLMVGSLVLDDEVGDDDSIEALLREACLPPSSPQSPLPPHTTSPAPLSPRPVPPPSTEDEASATLIFLTPPPHTGPSPPSLPPGLGIEAAPPVAQPDQAPISVRNNNNNKRCM